MSIAEKLTTVAENEQRVYEAGRNAEWNEIYDGLQACGGRNIYNHFCAYSNFIVDKDTTPRWNFKPKYDIKPTDATGMFRGFNSNNSGGVNYSNIKIDLVQWFEDLGIVLDTSKLTNVNTMFYNSQGISRVPFLDLSLCTGTASVANFVGQNAYLTIIDGIKSSEKTAWVSSSFDTNNPLKHCVFSGVIGKKFYIGNATRLDKESLISVINTLSSTTSELTATLSQTAVINAFGSTESDEWLNLIATKSNWTISLV